MIINPRPGTGAPPESVRQAQLEAARANLADQGDTVHTESRPWEPEAPPAPIPASPDALAWDQVKVKTQDGREISIDDGPDFKVDATKVKPAAPPIEDEDDDELVPAAARARRSLQIPQADLAEDLSRVKAAIAGGGGGLIIPVGDDWNFDIDEAPDDGTVIEAVGRYEDARTGFPRYVHFFDGAWRDVGRTLGHPLVIWCWKPRTTIWPKEPR